MKLLITVRNQYVNDNRLHSLSERNASESDDQTARDVNSKYF